VCDLQYIIDFITKSRLRKCQIF